MERPETRMGMHRPQDSAPGHATRRRFLWLAAGGSAAIAVARPADAVVPGNAAAASLDIASASPELVDFMTAFFAAKTSRDVDATMAFFSPDLVTYTDATLGWDLPNHDALRAVFADYMPKWPATARSYPTRLVGDMKGGAFIAFTDTPELFGGELRLLAAIDFKDGKIVRWIDHWDSRDWPNAYGIARSPLGGFHETEIPASASPRMIGAAERLFAVFAAGKVDAASDLFSEDVVFEDMALRSQLLGRTAVHAYLDRALASLPYGPGAALRHVTGSDAGGAVEWNAVATAPVRTGVTGVVLDGDGRIARLTTVYDGGLYDKAAIGAMSAAVLNL